MSERAATAWLDEKNDHNQHRVVDGSKTLRGWSLHRDRSEMSFFESRRRATDVDDVADDVDDAVDNDDVVDNDAAPAVHLPQYLTTWFALTPARVANGCVWVLPRRRDAHYDRWRESADDDVVDELDPSWMGSARAFLSLAAVVATAFIDAPPQFRWRQSAATCSAGRADCCIAAANSTTRVRRLRFCVPKVGRPAHQTRPTSDSEAEPPHRVGHRLLDREPTAAPRARAADPRRATARLRERESARHEAVASSTRRAVSHPEHCAPARRATASRLTLLARVCGVGQEERLKLVCVQMLLYRENAPLPVRRGALAPIGC